LKKGVFEQGRPCETGMACTFRGRHFGLSVHVEQEFLIFDFRFSIELAQVRQVPVEQAILILDELYRLLTDLTGFRGGENIFLGFG
jgi:hypothetical protein